VFTAIPSAAETLGLTAPERLNEAHDVSAFDCGEPSINDFLRRRASTTRHAAVYVSCFEGTTQVAAYYTLTNASVARDIMPKKLQRNSPAEHPLALLGRMGVTLSMQGKGVASDLVQDAIERAIYAAQIVASTGIIVHPLNARLEAFYSRIGFKPIPDLSEVTMLLSFR